MNSVFFEIGFIIVLATLLGGILKYFRQPLVLAYIFTGIFVKLFTFAQVNTPETLTFFSHLGIAFLLFIIGLELNPNELKETGKKSLIISLLQISVTSVVCFVISLILGFNLLQSFLIAIALTFSSTIIVVRLLSEKNDINSLYGRISIAILLFQDVVAMLILVLMSGMVGEGASVWTFILTILKAVVFFAMIYLFAKEFLQNVFKFLASSSELIFLGGIAWCLFLAGLASFAGFSLEIGAFLAGISLAATKYRIEIGTKIKPLRDFFITIFFVVLGLNLSINSLKNSMGILLVFLLVVFLIKPLIIMFSVGKIGYKKRVAFLSGISFTQISEFSLIIISMGQQAGVIDDTVVSIITIVSVITIIVSSYLMNNDEKLYKLVKPYLSVLENEKAVYLKKKREQELVEHTILIGCHRMGYDFLNIFDKLGIPFAVLDFDPKVIRQLESLGIDCVFGDIGDPEILDEINLHKAKLIISTVPNFYDNLLVVDTAKKINPEIKIIVTAAQVDEAFTLYNAGADYVILPHLLGGHFVSNLLEKHWEKWDDFKRIKEKHLSDLVKRKELGQFNS